MDIRKLLDMMVASEEPMTSWEFDRLIKGKADTSKPEVPGKMFIKNNGYKTWSANKPKVVEPVIEKVIEQPTKVEPVIVFAPRVENKISEVLPINHKGISMVDIIISQEKKITSEMNRSDIWKSAKIVIPTTVIPTTVIPTQQIESMVEVPKVVEPMYFMGFQEAMTLVLLKNKKVRLDSFSSNKVVGMHENGLSLIVDLGSIHYMSYVATNEELTSNKWYIINA